MWHVEAWEVGAGRQQQAQQQLLLLGGAAGSPARQPTSRQKNPAGLVLYRRGIAEVLQMCYSRAASRSQSYLFWKKAPSSLRLHSMLTAPRSMSSARPADN